VCFILKHNYVNTSAALPSENQEPQITWLEHHVVVNLGPALPSKWWIWHCYNSNMMCSLFKLFVCLFSMGFGNILNIRMVAYKKCSCEFITMAVWDVLNLNSCTCIQWALEIIIILLYIIISELCEKVKKISLIYTNLLFNMCVHVCHWKWFGYSYFVLCPWMSYIVTPVYMNYK
jgi:hypothetical protein